MGSLYFLLSVIFSLNAGASGVVTEVLIDPAFKTQVLKVGSETRGETYFGGSQSFALGYETTKLLFFLNYQQSKEQYDFDGSRKDLEAKGFGAGAGYKFLKYFRSGLQVLSQQIQITDSSNQTLEIEGFNFDIFADGKVTLYKDLYVFGRISKILFSSLKSKGFTQVDYKASGQSFQLGLGYLF